MAALNQGGYHPLAHVIGTWGGGYRWALEYIEVEKRSKSFDYVDGVAELATTD